MGGYILLFIKLLVRTLSIYLLLVALLKIGGKRQIGELQLSELITAFMISDIATAPIINPDTSIIHAIIPATTVILLEIILSYVTTKSQRLKKLLDGTADIVINKGKLDIKKLGKLRMSIEELICEARQAGIRDLADVEYAILEENGRFSFFEKPTSGEEKVGVAHTLVVDGSLCREGMTAANMTEEKLRAMLKKSGAELSDVFLFTVNDAGDSHLIRKPPAGRLKRTCFRQP